MFRVASPCETKGRTRLTPTRTIERASCDIFHAVRVYPREVGGADDARYCAALLSFRDDNSDRRRNNACQKQLEVCQRGRRGERWQVDVFIDRRGAWPEIQRLDTVTGGT